MITKWFSLFTKPFVAKKVTTCGIHPANVILGIVDLDDISQITLSDWSGSRVSLLEINIKDNILKTFADH